MDYKNYWTKHYSSRSFLLGCLFCICTFSLSAQVNIELTVLDGEATTTCTDGNGIFKTDGDPTWSVNVENTGWLTYSKENCALFSDYPNLHYNTMLTCLSDLRGGEIQVCLRVFDNETSLFNTCDDSDRDCDVPICMNFLLPEPGSDSTYKLVIPAGLTSGGFLDFKIAVSEDDAVTTNDRICHAINLGTLTDGGILGNASKGIYNNYCASNIREPSPHTMGIGWQNNVATWFSFTTSDDPNAIVLVEARSDPENSNDPVNLQLALYQSMDGTCTSELTFIKQNTDNSDFDEFLILDCLEPNQNYFIMVDGENATEESTYGVYGIQVSEVDISNDFSDGICDAIPITLNEGGQLYENFFNNCATNTDDPSVTNFSTNNSVWFEFRPTESRRAEIFIVSDLPYPAGIDAIDLQMAVYYAPSNNCTGSLVEVASTYSATDGNDEFLRLECLNPKLRYFLMVDGSDTDPTGVFDMIVNDPGYPEPIALDTTICEGDVLDLGNKTYVNAGIYLDTIITDDDCLAIIETNLSTVPPINIILKRERISGALGQADGIQIVSVSGGTGNYTIEWSNGSTNQVATNLVGGDEYCVTVADAAGCERMECFIMEYIIPIAFQVENDTVNCASDIDGQLTFSVSAGQVPYSYTVQGIDDPSVIEIGAIIKNDSTITVNNLPVGTYNVTIKNQYTGDTESASIEAPEPMTLSLVDQVNPTCFGSCSGAIELTVSGGTGDFQYSWNNGIAPVSNPRDICAGDYFVTVSDANNCRDSLNLSIIEPARAIIEAIQVEPVQCFGESNGQATINSNENIINFLWDNGETTDIATNLDAGIHEVTITNDNNCESIASVEITQPISALVAKIEIMESIACGGDANGVLADISTGGNGNYQYNWSNGITRDLIDNLPTGDYALTVTDDKGCQDMAMVQLVEPTPVEAEVTSQDVTCPAGENSGAINIGRIEGGTAPYRFSIDDNFYSSNSDFNNLAADSYQVYVQDANGCKKVYPQLINNPPEVSVTIGDDLDIKLGEDLDLEAISNRSVIFEWASTGDTLNCLDCPTINTQPTSDAQYSVKVTDISTGCIAEDAITVRVLKNRQVFFPNVFSPNGDGRNDELMMMGGGNVESILKFQIFDRKGALIFDTTNFLLGDFEAAWDGLYNGQKAPAGVYLYYAEIRFIDGAIIPFQGDFALIR